MVSTSLTNMMGGRIVPTSHISDPGFCVFTGCLDGMCCLMSPFFRGVDAATGGDDGSGGDGGDGAEDGSSVEGASFSVGASCEEDGVRALAPPARYSSSSSSVSLWPIQRLDASYAASAASSLELQVLDVLVLVADLIEGGVRAGRGEPQMTTAVERAVEAALDGPPDVGGAVGAPLLVRLLDELEVALRHADLAPDLLLVDLVEDLVLVHAAVLGRLAELDDLPDAPLVVVLKLPPP